MITVNTNTLMVRGEDGTLKPILAIKGDKGEDGVIGRDGTSATHSWNGTTLTITSASGTSSADLKGEKGDRGTDGDLSDAEYNSLRAKLDEVIADKDANLDGRVSGLGYVKESQLPKWRFVGEATRSNHVALPQDDSWDEVMVECIFPLNAHWHNTHIYLRGMIPDISVASTGIGGVFGAYQDSSGTHLYSFNITSEYAVMNNWFYNGTDCVPTSTIINFKVYVR